nr:hypothetical protein [Tanacetum cinerariifolium]
AKKAESPRSNFGAVAGEAYTFESSDDSTNVVNAPREPIVVKTDHGVKSSQNPPPIDECCCECGNALNGIFCQQCICKSCEKGAHIGYNCPPKVPIISNPEPCNQTLNNELPQTLPSFDSVPCVSKPNFVDESSNIFNPPPQPPIYSCEFCESNAQYGHYCTPQAQFNNLEQGYSPDFNFLQNIHNFQQQLTIVNLTRVMVLITPVVTKLVIFTHNNIIVVKIAGDLMKPFSSSVIHQPPQELSIQEMEDLKQQYLDELKSLSNLEYRDEIKIAELTENLNDEVIKSSVEDLVPIPSESEGIPEHKCDVPFHDNFPPLDVSKDQIEDFSESNNEVSSIDDDSFSVDNIDYVEASPPDSELVSSEVMEIVIPEETNTFHNSLPEFENFYFDLGEISSGSTTTHSDISLPDYEAFYFNNDHIKEISSGSTTTHSDISLSEYDSFIFDLTHEEFVDELAHIISPPEYDCFYFRNLPDSGELMSVLNSGIRENLSTTLMNLPIEDDYSPLLAYV